MNEIIFGVIKNKLNIIRVDEQIERTYYSDIIKQ